MLDSARAFLRANRYPDHVIEGGLERLLDGWESIASSVASGEVQFQDDYLNDVDGRHILHLMLPDLTDEQRVLATRRLAAADNQIRPHLVRTTECIWGVENEQRYKYDEATHWWYYHRPRTVDESWRSF